MDPGLLPLLDSTVTIYERTGYNNYGAPQFSTQARTFQCRWTRQVQEVRDNHGDILVASDMIWVNSTSYVPTAEDKYVLPDGRTPEVLTVAAIHDENGLDHVKVSFGHQRYVR